MRAIWLQFLMNLSIVKAVASTDKGTAAFCNIDRCSLKSRDVPKSPTLTTYCLRFQVRAEGVLGLVSSSNCPLNCRLGD